MSIQKVAVIGAGIMGSGIALACAAGYSNVTIWDVQKKAVEDALIKMTSALDTLAQSELIATKNVDAVMQRVKHAGSMEEAVESAELVFEAVPERIELKKRVFGELDSKCSTNTILASNTSTFRISELASATSRPDKVIGTHWMNPPYLLPLVEVIPSTKTSKVTTDNVKSYLSTIGKRPILCKDTPGFLINRMHSALLVEVIAMVEEGVASMQDIDLAWTQHLGPRYCTVGPFQLLDMFGLDTELSQYSYLYEEVGNEKFNPPQLLKSKVKNGELGLKKSKGFYDYSAENIESLVKERDKQLLAFLHFLGITRQQHMA